MRKLNCGVRLSLLLIILLAIITQSYYFLRSDTNWLMTIGERFLDGGTYTSDFIETNPPMSIYLYLPAVLLSHVTNLNFTIAARIYTFLVIFISFLLCKFLLSKLLENNQPLYIGSIITLLATYTLLPGYDFTQREHFAVMLIMPYFLFCAGRAQGFFPNKLFAVAIGLLAGIGFAIKPHIMLAFITVETYLLLHSRKLLTILRIETITIVSVFLMCFLAALLFNREYLDILPYVRDFFQIFFQQILHDPGQSIITLLSNYKAVFTFGILLAYFISRNQLTNRTLIDLVAMGTLGLFFFAVSEPIFFDYHFLPPFILSVFLALILLFDLFDTRTTSSKKNFTLLCTLSIILILPIKEILIANKRGLNTRHEITITEIADYLIQHNSKGPLYFLSLNCNQAIYIPTLTNIKNISSYECVWPTITLAYHIDHPGSSSHERYEANKNFFIHSIINDMKRYPPEYVFTTPVISWDLRRFREFDYIKLLSESPEFRKIWKHYKLAGSLHDTLIFKRS